MTVFCAIRRYFSTWALLAAASSASALPSSPSQQAEAFAICAGRYAAQASQSTEFTQPRANRAIFEDLLDAVLPAAEAYGMPKTHAANAKFQAWRDHAYLHNDANFATDPGRQARAAARLARDISECDALVL
ncbi:hypothetical protein [uncultured Sulfitobacter sp.]|uniref:hypothetical protein n=1 Tax=uncultured Sulfitobacter sp. TaxID=191468 RepID=UPI00260996EA|nr:hypothetical protein [uncultured Sulfitobacter sp.]